MSDLINRLLHAAESGTGRTGPLLQEAANEICALKSRIEIRAPLPEAPAVPVEDAPISRLMRDNGDPEWKQITALLRENGVNYFPIRLRDELSTMLAWARYGERSALVTPPAPTAAVDGAIPARWPSVLRSRADAPNIRDTEGTVDLLRRTADYIDAALSKAHLSPGTAEPTERNKLVIDAYRAMDAIDAIRAWCDAQPYANDGITVARLREMLPNNRTEPSPGEDWVYDRGYLKRPDAALAVLNDLAPPQPSPGTADIPEGEPDAAAAIRALAEYNEVGGTSLEDVEKELGFTTPSPNDGEAKP
jgi:hypothetical protein